MSDERLRDLERRAALDPDAARRLAVERFRLTGDCGTALCGNAARPGNPSVNNHRSAISPSTACPSCNRKATRDYAEVSLRKAWRERRRTGKRKWSPLPKSVIDFARGNPARSEMFERGRRLRWAALVLNRLGIGWFRDETTAYDLERVWSHAIVFVPGSVPEDAKVTPSPLISTRDENVYAFWTERHTRATSDSAT